MDLTWEGHNTKVSRDRPTPTPEWARDSQRNFSVDQDQDQELKIPIRGRSQVCLHAVQTGPRCFIISEARINRPAGVAAPTRGQQAGGAQAGVLCHLPRSFLGVGMSVGCMRIGGGEEGLWAGQVERVLEGVARNGLAVPQGLWAGQRASGWSPGEGQGGGPTLSTRPQGCGAE